MPESVPAAPGTSAVPALAGRVLGEFVIGEELGAGGMGVVYRARQTSSDREVVIKVLLADRRQDANTQQRFLREAKLASSLNHPFAAHIYDFGAEPDGLLWIAMELVPGTTLGALMAKNGSLSLPRLVPFMERICEVVDAAHAQGIIHRDLKPANIMVLSHAGRYSPKLLDLGVAKMWSESSASLDGNTPSSLDSALTPSTPAYTALQSTTSDEPTAEIPGAPPLAEEAAQLKTAARPLPVPVDVPELSAVSTPSVHKSVQLSLADNANAELTQYLAIIGTPAYIAPELWVSPRFASPRSDIYALGVILFEMICGRRPFRSTTTTGYIMAHRSAVPDLGPEYSRELQAVVEKALARDPAHRFASGAELASALRVAAALPGLEELPRLPESLREQSMNGLPEPLAELVATVDAARSPNALHAAAVQAARGISAFLATLALGARLRAGPGGKDDPPQTKALFKALGSHRLETAEWLELASALTGPFSGLEAAYPLPELVHALHPRHPAKDRGPGLREHLLELVAVTPDPATLHMLVSKLALVLDGVSFLCGYSVAVESAGAAELWRGTRSRHRAVQAVHTPLNPGEAILLDGDGGLAFSLAPLVQALPPSPGAVPELFLFAGSGRDGARLVSLGLAFERHAPGLTGELQRAGLSISPAASGEAAVERAPYLGLSSFTASDSGLFFGREREAEACANRLREQSLLAVAGPSGAGKSSFVQAGIVPLLPGGWSAITVRPGQRPLNALEQKLEQAGYPAQNLALRLLEAPEALGELLRNTPRGAGVVLFVDQFEELITLCPSEPERRAYSKALALAAGDPSAPVRVVLAMRDDFLIAIKQLPGLQERLALGLELLATPGRDDLVRILVEPARRAGLHFEDEDLPGEIADAVAHQAGALPLLSFTALKLWELRDRRLQRFTRQAYGALGGVGGALAQHADKTLAQLTVKEAGLVREAFRHLVTTAGTRAIMRRDEMEQLLGASALGQTVLERLVSARLLVTSEGEGGVDRIEVIHETLLSKWPRLVQWQREDAESSRIREELRAAARQWEEKGRPKGILWRGDVLAELKLWKARFGGALTKVEASFVAASLAADRQAALLIRGGAAAVFLGLLVGLVAVAHSMREARASVLRLTIDQGREQLLAGDPLRAMALLLNAKKQGAEGPMFDTLLTRASGRLEGQERIFPAGHDQLWVALYSPDDSQVLTAGVDATARLFSTETGALTATLSGHQGVIRRGAFSPDGTLVATASMDKTCVLWSAKTGHRLFVLPHPAAVTFIAFKPDGLELLTSSDDGVARAFDVKTGQRVHTYGSPGPASLHYALWTPDGASAVAGYDDGAIRIFRASNGALVSTLSGHTQATLRASLSPDGKYLLTTSVDRTARVFNLTTGKSQSVFRLHSGTVFSIAWSSNGKHVASGGVDGSVFVWNPMTGAVETQFKHAGLPSSLQFSPDGRTLLISDGNTSVQTWSVPEGELRWSYLGHADGVYSAMYSKDAKHFLTAGVDGTARLWDATLDETALRLAGFAAAPGRKESTVTFLESSADGRALSGTSAAGNFGRWSLPDGHELLRSDAAARAEYEEYRFTAAPRSPDGKHVAMTAGGAAQIRDANTFELLQTFPHSDELTDLAWSPAGDLLAGAYSNGAVTVWRVQTGETLHELKHDGKAMSVAFSPDGKRLVTASKDHSVRVWDVATGARLLVLVHQREAGYATFDSTGERILSSSEDKTAVLWNAKTGAQLRVIEAPAGIYHAVLSPDGTLVAGGGDDGVVWLWDAASGKRLDTVGQLDGSAWVTVWNAAGTAVLSGDDHGIIKLWNLPRTPPSESHLAALEATRIPFRVTPEGTLAARELVAPQTEAR